MTNPLTADQRRAFLSAPDPRRYYAASAIEEARQRIVRAIARSEGPALLVGAGGSGKSLLLAVLAEQFEPRMSVVTLPGAQLCTRRALLQMILSELHLPYRHMDEGELRLSILEHLRGRSATVDAPAAARPRRMLLLVDEADALPTRLLEELRVLTNVVAHGAPLASIVLAGSPVLEERFADPQLDMFAQRLACRCYLAPLTREETFQFVRSQVSAVGVKPEKWFDPEALAAIHAATGGNPRLVNQLGDQLVWLIEETGCQPLDAALVQQAWSDLQQLPAPWNTDAHSSLSSPPAASVGPNRGSAYEESAYEGNVIEFGELDAESPSAAPELSVHEPALHELPADGDRATELFHPSHTTPMPRGEEFDDDLPASIPFAQPPLSSRAQRDADLGAYAADLDAAEQLIDRLDEFDELELASEPTPLPSETETPSEPAAAENPFAEPFEEEEILVDPYADFESQVLRSARHVLNRIDRTFAAELARCETRRCTKPAIVSPDPVTAHRSPRPAPSSAPLLIVEPNAERGPAIVPGQKLRRLFSSLESTAARTRQG
jgi:type II secretory pathway predicted ATPase ExeA